MELVLDAQQEQLLLMENVWLQSFQSQHNKPSNQNKKQKQSSARRMNTWMKKQKHVKNVNQTWFMMKK